MHVVHLALKDLKLLFRNRMAAFFILGFPVMMGLFFGMMMSGMSSGKRGKMEIAVIDQDNSRISARFIEALRKNENINVIADELEHAKESVRKAQRTGLLVIPNGFGETAGFMWELQPEIELGMDPSRSAEGAMLQGFIMQATGELIGERFNHPQDFLPHISKAKEALMTSNTDNLLMKQVGGAFFDSLSHMIESADKWQRQAGTNPDNQPTSMHFANVKSLDISRHIDPSSAEAQTKKIRTRWDISFPQAMLWGVLGSIAGFSASIARERTSGTLVRLQSSPLSRMHIMLGKALACFLAVILVISVMLVIGLFLGMRPTSFTKLAAASGCTAICFVGIMLTISVLGKTEQGVEGVGWSINMVMAMLGGCMIPVMFMPAVFQKLSVFSPIRWSILSIEGAIWRDFSWSELALPFTIMLVVGIVGFGIGTSILVRRTTV